MYTGNFRLFLTIGLIFIPISIVVAGLQAGLFLLERRRSLFRVIVVVAVVASSLTLTFFLMPVAIWILVRWSLVAQVGVIEDRSARDALRRSSQLVRRHWLRTLLTVVGVALIALVSGPFIGALALLGTDTAVWVANLIAAIIYVFALPFVAVATTFLYFDLRVRHAIEADSGDAPLPSELDDAGTTGATVADEGG